MSIMFKDSVLFNSMKSSTKPEKIKGGLEPIPHQKPLPSGTRILWISLNWEENGIARTHDFNTVQELASFLKDRPELGKKVGYKVKSG